MTSKSKRSFSKFPFLDEVNCFVLKRKPAPMLPTRKNLTPLRSKMTSQLTLDFTIGFLFSQKVLTAELRLKTFSEDINKEISTKNFYNKS